MHTYRHKNQRVVSLNNTVQGDVGDRCEFGGWEAGRRQANDDPGLAGDRQLMWASVPKPSGMPLYPAVPGSNGTGRGPGKSGRGGGPKSERGASLEWG